MTKSEEEALRVFLELSDAEQIAYIDRVLGDTGIFDGECLRDDWQEILKKKRGIV